MPRKKEKPEINSLDEAIDEIKRQFGEGSIMKLTEMKQQEVDAIPTGSISLDTALGVGGLPRGRIVEIFGPEASGKTTVSLHCAAQAQKLGGVVAFIDAEHALDPAYAKRIGVKTDDLLISQPDSGEQALQIAENLVRSGAVDIIIIDSVAALTPKAEIAGEMGDQHIGLQARLMSQGLRKLSGIVSKTKTIIIFLNQTRMKIGIMFGNPETTPGGLALKFYASTRIRLQPKAKIKQGDRIIGTMVEGKIIKNKVAPPFRIAEFNIYYNEGISYFADIINAGLKYGSIKKSGSWLEFEGEKLGQGLEGAKQFLKENPKIAEKIKKDIVVKAKEAEI
ncbi:MAG: recombinase RecA [Candidatus Paceibacterota bacterium]|jgi:recombination protein RecA|nr:recombinase RecA [Candidatus Paceibacterota bacterium]